MPWPVKRCSTTGWPNLREHSPPTIAASESTDRRDCAPDPPPQGTAVAGKMLFMIAAEMERDLIRERISADCAPPGPRAGAAAARGRR
jgi:hypothetical protein